MADSCQGGSTDATAAQGMEGADDWELLPKDGGDCGEEAVAAERQESRHRGVTRDEPATRAKECCGYKRRVGDLPFLLLPRSTSVHKAMYTITFGYLPLIVCVHLSFLHKMPRFLPLPTEQLWIPAFFVTMYIVHAGLDFVMYMITVWMQQSNLGTPFGVFLHVKLLFRLSLFIPARSAAVVLTSGIKVIWGHFVKAAILDAQDSYRKCLGPLGCLPRTLPDLYDCKTCAVTAWWEEPLGHSRDDVLRTGACMYDMLFSLENGEPIQMHTDMYAGHVQSFVRDYALAACLWLFALCAILPEVVVLTKMLWDDVAAVAALYKRYTREQRREDATPSKAFHEASLKCLRRTYYPQMNRCIIRLAMVTRLSVMGLQQPSSRADQEVANNAQSTAMDCS